MCSSDLEGLDCEIIVGDITDSKLCLEVCSRVDVVCCQAALGSVPRSMNEPLNSHTSNVHGFATLLDAARVSGVKRFVYASSSAVYGNTKDVEDMSHCFPVSFYGLNKKVNDLYAQYYSQYFGLECVGLRYHNVFGRNQSVSGEYSAVIPIFITRALAGETLTIHGDGTQYRDFTHIDNVVEANLLAMFSTTIEEFGVSVDIGSNTKVSVGELASSIIAATDSTSSIHHVDTRAGDIHASAAVMEAAETALGYKPLRTFSDGLALTIPHY